MTLRSFIPLLLLLASVPVSRASEGVKSQGWQPDPALLKKLDDQHVAWLHREELVRPYTLPDPLLCNDGSRVTSAAEWEAKRRPETLDLFREFVYGRPPADPAKVSFDVIDNDPKALDGAATLKRVRITAADGSGKSFAFEAAVLTPNGATHPVPAFLLINNRSVASADPTRAKKDDFWPAELIIARGYATAVFRTADVDPDRDGPDARAQGVRGVWPAGGGTEGHDAWGTIGAWAWGASRVLDYLRTEPAIDASKVAVIGHSRGGKTALWAAAQDTRFAMAIANCSGRGGASLSRRRFGETVARINQAFPYWFCGNFKQFNDHEDQLPVDQHQLLALIAPRALYVADADADFWADQRGEFLSLAAASPVYALYGFQGFKPDEMPPLETPLVRGPLAYHIRRGVHNLTRYNWERYLDFADHLWPDRAPPSR
jgi:hypothetical protein